MSDHTSRVDPVTAEILRAAFVSITDEMKTNLMRTAYNLIIYEAQDFTVGLFDENGDTISVGMGLPMFIRGLSDAIKAKLEYYGPDGIEPGDVLLTNDAYIMGSHLNHMIFTLPIFHDGKLVAFAASMAHWLDVGGVLHGPTEDIYSEGLQMPIVKIFKRGVQDDELTRIIATNVRLPDTALGDFRAQIAAVRTGETRMQELLARYGADTIKASVSDMFVRSEELARQAVRRIADGTYTAEAFMDDDGVRIGRSVPIKVTVHISGDSMTVDLSEVSPQVTGYFNSGSTAGRSAVEVAFKFLTSPGVFPINDGSFRPVQCVLPAGTVVSATKPAAMRLWMTYPMTVVDCIFRALADAVPEGTIAGHHADLSVAILTGTDATGRVVFFPNGPPGGGWGATSRHDGRSAVICINDGDTHNVPVEAVEAKQEIALVEEYALREDSGGAGRFRGGLGIRTTVRIRGSGRLATNIERTQCAPWGLGGGLDAEPNRIRVVRDSGEELVPPTGKMLERLQSGDCYVVESGGGGGYGDPHDRPTSEVLADVRAGYVSVDAARELYGTVITGSPETGWTVDEDATASVRTLR